MRLDDKKKNMVVKSNANNMDTNKIEGKKMKLINLKWDMKILTWKEYKTQKRYFLNHDRPT